MTFDLSLRFPGQYTDKETGLSHNYFRDYDASVGRYAQSDPVGLNGGLNTYAYVESAPLTGDDFYGLITGTMKGFKRVNCPSDERAECADRCRAEGKIVKSCKVTRGTRWVVRNGTAVPELYTVPGSMSCECDCPVDDKAFKRFWDWLTAPRYKTDDPLAPITGSRAKPANPVGTPPSGPLPGFAVP